ncbi:hypothetical protein OIY81_2289 [Cryptosporidium canis]|uniref:RRM domain-containing protein n=1 Tax=Cryptosporidium canis TaxID=195482 RepID=A0ABQ8P3Z6_9CRYT|nr:hypothetical protein OJ252_2854 [Cryptosporidium canis]KAJ1609627.1 hypothetical protein OIY81_2289 [Cryptosporidium canis]
MYQSSQMDCNRGVGENTRGTAFVVYDEIEDAKSAYKQLSGLKVSGRTKYELDTAISIPYGILLYTSSILLKNYLTNKNKQMQY